MRLTVWLTEQPDIVVLAALAGQHHPDLFLKGIALARLAPDILDTALHGILIPSDLRLITHS